MTKEEHILSCLAEECAEVIQQVSKCLRFGYTDKHPGLFETNVERLQAEVKDMLAVLEMLQDYKIFSIEKQWADRKYINSKKDRVNKFMEHALKTGALCPHLT